MRQRDDAWWRRAGDWWRWHRPILTTRARIEARLDDASEVTFRMMLDAQAVAAVDRALIVEAERVA